MDASTSYFDVFEVWLDPACSWTRVHPWWLLPNLSDARQILTSAVSSTTPKRPLLERARGGKQASFPSLCTFALSARLILFPFVFQLRDLRSRDRFLEQGCIYHVERKKAEGRKQEGVENYQSHFVYPMTKKSALRVQFMHIKGPIMQLTRWSLSGQIRDRQHF